MGRGGGSDGQRHTFGGFIPSMNRQVVLDGAEWSRRSAPTATGILQSRFNNNNNKSIYRHFKNASGAKTGKETWKYREIGNGTVNVKSGRWRTTSQRSNETN